MSGSTFWLTGLPRAGKSTLARALEAELRARWLTPWVLDGDDVRRRLCADLGSSPEDRDENVCRVAYVAEAVTRVGGVAIVAVISPRATARAAARAAIGRFVEVHVDAPVEVCAARDEKGVYRRALTGEIPDFTGISAPYEPPVAPEVHLATDTLGVEECVTAVLRATEELGYLTTDEEV